MNVRRRPCNLCVCTSYSWHMPQHRGWTSYGSWDWTPPYTTHPGIVGSSSDTTGVSTRGQPPRPPDEGASPPDSVTGARGPLPVTTRLPLGIPVLVPPVGSRGLPGVTAVRLSGQVDAVHVLFLDVDVCPLAGDPWEGARATEVP